MPLPVDIGEISLPSSSEDIWSPRCVDGNNCLAAQGIWDMAGPNGPCVSGASVRGRTNMDTACEGRDMTFWVDEWPRTTRGRR